MHDVEHGYYLVSFIFYKIKKLFIIPRHSISSVVEFNSRFLVTFDIGLGAAF